MRWVIDNAAASGDTVDASNLACSSITLTSGAIAVHFDSLTIKGPSHGYLTIDAGNASRIFAHYGTGQLELDDILAINGRTTADNSGLAAGGCVYSQGGVLIKNGGAKYCHAEGGVALGGAVFAAGNVSLSHSKVTLGYALSDRYALGGGVYANRDFLAKYSTVANSMASANYGEGGGVWADGDGLLDHSTISGNVADIVGGIAFRGAYPDGGITVLDSTIADNMSERSFYGSGLYLGDSTTLANSTISGNVERNARNQKYGAGVFVRHDTIVDMESTAVGDNMIYNTAYREYLADDMGSDVSHLAVGGANNLVYVVSQQLQLPGDTLRERPMLGPLQNNGGETPTEMPEAGSPLIDAGNIAMPSVCDQRGPGFARVVDGRADVGAVEIDAGSPPDGIFSDGFDPTSSMCSG